MLATSQLGRYDVEVTIHLRQGSATAAGLHARKQENTAETIVYSGRWPTQALANVDP